MEQPDIRADWAVHFARTVAQEIRSGVRSGAITIGEAEELLARLRVLVDQALDMAPLLRCAGRGGPLTAHQLP
jgi:hypothetical protein